MATWSNTAKSTHPDNLLIEGSDHEYLLLETGDRILLEKAGYVHFEFLTDRHGLVVGESTDTGATSPGTMADDDTVGTRVWNNPNGAKVSDDARANVLLQNQTSRYLKATNFGFAIPTGATIDGILVEIEQKYLAAISKENSIKIIKGGAISGDEKSTGATLPAADT
ncbi:hypothetical protein LCGC14_3073800, partial [marine sediment metagenome]